MPLPMFDFGSLSGMAPIALFNSVVGLVYSLLYFYQIVYMLYVLVRGNSSLPPAKKQHKFAFFVAAHNEEAVIGALVRSVKNQDYPADLVDCFVVCDACTDDTHGEAERAGAIVWDRNDLARKGKSWAMDYGFNRILEEYGDTYEAFIVLDADNIVAPNYVTKMNEVFDAGYLVSTSYRNSKNYDSSWISSAYATSFMREARFLNNPRMALGTSCAISGTGWMVSEKIIRGMHGWDFHTLTEDIQFSIFCGANNIQIGYVDAEFFDEQPLTFKASWIQRMRWTKGFYQVFFSYARDLLHGVRRGKWAAYDMFAMVAPAIILSLIMVFINITYLVVGSLSHGYLATQAELTSCWISIFYFIGGAYVTFFFVGLIATISEFKRIHCKKKWRILTNLLTYPIFMMSYIPINVVALFRKVEWVPTKHDISVNFDEVVGGSKEETKA